MHPGRDTLVGALDYTGNVWEMRGSACRVLRGGGWGNVAGGSRFAYRFIGGYSFRGYGLGFRISRSVSLGPLAGSFPRSAAEGAVRRNARGRHWALPEAFSHFPAAVASRPGGRHSAYHPPAPALPEGPLAAGISRQNLLSPPLSHPSADRN
jgi:hypothetical protein